MARFTDFWPSCWFRSCEKLPRDRRLSGGTDCFLLLSLVLGESFSEAAPPSQPCSFPVLRSEKEKHLSPSGTGPCTHPSCLDDGRIRECSSSCDNKHSCLSLRRPPFWTLLSVTCHSCFLIHGSLCDSVMLLKSLIPPYVRCLSFHF